jgi:hypothetical protein
LHVAEGSLQQTNIAIDARDPLLCCEIGNRKLKRQKRINADALDCSAARDPAPEMPTVWAVQQLGEKAWVCLLGVDNEAIDRPRLDRLLFKISRDAATGVFRYEQQRSALKIIRQRPVSALHPFIGKHRADRPELVPSAWRQLAYQTLVLKIHEAALVMRREPGPDCARLSDRPCLQSRDYWSHVFQSSKRRNQLLFLLLPAEYNERALDVGARKRAWR